MGKEKSGKPGRILEFSKSLGTLSWYQVPGTGTRFKVDLVFPGFPGFGSLTEKTKTEKK